MPTVWVDVAVPAATNDVPHWPATQVGIVHSFGGVGQSVATLHVPASAVLPPAPPELPLLVEVAPVDPLEVDVEVEVEVAVELVAPPAPLLEVEVEVEVEVDPLTVPELVDVELPVAPLVAEVEEDDAIDPVLLLVEVEDDVEVEVEVEVELEVDAAAPPLPLPPVAPLEALDALDALDVVAPPAPLLVELEKPPPSPLPPPAPPDPPWPLPLLVPPGVPLVVACEEVCPLPPHAAAAPARISASEARCERRVLMAARTLDAREEAVNPGHERPPRLRLVPDPR